MAYQSTTTAKITADTSGVQKAIKDLKEELKSMGSSITTDDARKKLEAITKATVPASAKLKELKKIAKEIEFSGFDDVDLITDVANAIAQTTEESNLMKDAIKKAQNELKAVSEGDQFKSVRDSINKTAKEITGLEDKEKELKKIQEEYLKQNVDKNNPQWKALQAEIKKTELALKKAKGQQDNFLKVDFGPFKGQLDSLANSFNVLGGKAGGVTSMLGKMGPALSNPYVLAGTAVVGLGVALYDYNKKLDESLQKTQQFTGLNGNELMSLRNGIEACASSWGKDYNTVLNGVDVLMSYFGMSGEKALDIISKGFTSGADDAGKMLDQMKKYSGAFKDMGISADELTALISQTKSGIFSEEGMDLIQKAGTKLREFNDKTAESLQSIGINTEEMFAKMQSGELRTVDAVKMVSARLKDVGVQSQEAGRVLKEVFGKEGARVGMELVTALSEVETSLDKCVQGADEMHKANKRLEDAQRELENALSSMFGVANGGFATMVTTIKTEVIKYVTELINKIIDLYNESIAFRGVIHGVVFVFKSAYEVSKVFFDEMIAGFKALGTMIEGVLELDPSKITKGWSDFSSAMYKNVSSAIDNIIDDFNEMLDYINNSKIEKVTVPVETETTTGTTVGGSVGGNKITGDKKGGKSKTEKIDYLISIDDETLNTAQKKLSAWEDKLKNLPVTATAEIEEAKKEIEKWKSEVERREFILNGKIAEGPLQKLQKKISELKEIQSKLNPEVDEEKIKEVVDQIKRYTDEESDLKVKLGVEIADGPLQKVQKEIQKLQEEKLRLNPEIDAQRIKEIEQQIDEAVQKERTIKIGLGDITKSQGFSDAQSMLQQLKADYANKLISREEVEKKVAEINSILSQLNLPTLELTITDDGKILTAKERIEEMQKSIQQASGFVGTMGQSFGQLGQVIGGTAGEFMKFVGGAIQGIASLIPQIASLFVAQQAEAEAGVASSASSLPFPANLIAMATGIASVVAMFASMPKFAEGGIVPGNSYTSDRIISALSSGEMVLNKRQQSNLFNLLDGNRTNTFEGGSVKFEIDGKVIKGVLNNTNKVNSKLK